MRKEKALAACHMRCLTNNQTFKMRSLRLRKRGQVLRQNALYCSRGGIHLLGKPHVMVKFRNNLSFGKAWQESQDYYRRKGNSSLGLSLKSGHSMENII